MKVAVAVLPSGEEWSDPSVRCAYDLWVVDAAGKSDPRRLSWLNGETAGSIIWSPDGRELAFIEMTGGRSAVYVTALDSKSPRKLQLQEAAPYVMRAWSSDRASLCIEAGLAHGCDEIDSGEPE